MNIQMLSVKINCINEFSILKLRENSLFHNFRDILSCKIFYQPTFDSMENQGKPLNNIEKIEVDEHTIVVNKNKLHQ